MTGGIKVPVSAEFDQQATEREVQRLTQQLNRVGEMTAQLNKMRWTPVDKGAVSDMRTMVAQFESLVRINGSLRQRLSSTGQAGKHFADVEWNRVYPDSNQRPRMLRSVFDYTTANTQWMGRMAVPPAAPAPAPHHPGGGGGQQPPAAPPAGFPGQQVVNAGLNAAGPVGRVASGALGAGMRGGLLAGAGAMLGGLAVLGAAKAVGAIRDKVGDAETESIGYDTLKRTLGDVAVDFEALRGSVRQAAVNINTSFNEAQRLGVEFAKLGNISSDRYRTIGREISVGGGLSRSLGLELGAGVGLLGTARGFGATQDEAGSRKLALMIGEAVGRVGFAKADDLVAVVTNFVQSQARTSLAAPNVSGYLGALVGLAGSGRPGLDPQGSAALLSRVNSSIMGGGGMGEAGSNFMLANVGRPLGLSPIQTRILLQQGAFGSGRQAFGPGSLYSTFSRRFGGSAGGAGASDQTNLESILGGLRRNYGGMGGDMLASATSGLLGITETQAMAMHTYGAASMGGIERRLRGKIPLSSLSATGFGALAKIQTGSLSDLQAQAESLRTRTGADSLSLGEAQRLREAMGSGNVESMRQVLTELTATREQETTEGKQTRDSIERVEREIQKFASMLIPVANATRDAIAAVAGVLAPDSAFGKAAADARRARGNEQRFDELRGGLDAFDAETQTIHGSDRYRKMNPGDKRAWDRARASRRAMLQDAFNREFGNESQVAYSLMQGLINAESGGRHYGPDGKLLAGPTLDDGTSALGITQVRPSTGKDPGFGVRPLKDQSQAEYLRFGQEYLAAMLRHYNGDKGKALAAYNWGVGNVDMYGDDWAKHAPKETRDYVEKVLAASGAGTAGAGRGLFGGPTASEIHADLILHPRTPDGKSAGKPVAVKVPRPTASGVAR